MRAYVNGPLVQITLSKRNLVSLLDALGDARGTPYLVRGDLFVFAEEDEVHYTDDVRGSSVIFEVNVDS